MSSLPDQVESALQRKLSEREKTDVRITGFSSVGGGCINNGGIVKTSIREYFLKWNDRANYPGMFEKESAGLKLLSSTGAIQIPEVISTGETEDFQYIVLSSIRQGSRSREYWTELGEALAQLHRHSSQMFGLGHNNYIGSLPQSNKQSTSWVDFYIEQRLQAQLNIAGNKIPKNVRDDFDKLFRKLPSMLAEEKPSLLHGDLWSGNVMVNEEGRPVLIDPAIYYGHREVDLAMTTLFGGFGSDFLRAYRNFFPLENGFEDRFEIYNLYPLLVHVNLFGGSYLSQVVRVLKRFV